uniref:Uncharacterized protein n=1 Tax=Fagus sylvatica TaxID=28930 RepID=A0A2N9ISP4_FAGSY
MAGKNAKKAASTSSKIPPNKLPEIKPDLVTPNQLVSKEFQFTKPECQPLWFLKWWSIHGSQAEIIPDTPWNTTPPTTKKDPPLSTKTLKQALLHFTKSYRNHAVKWWDNFDRDRIIKFVYDEFLEIKQVEDQPSSIPDLLKGKSPEKLAEICKLAAQACQAASASASGKGKSPASSEGSTTEMINLSQFSAPMKKNLYSRMPKILMLE